MGPTAGVIVPTGPQAAGAHGSQTGAHGSAYIIGVMTAGVWALVPRNHRVHDWQPVVPATRTTKVVRTSNFFIFDISRRKNAREGRVAIDLATLHAVGCCANETRRLFSPPAHDASSQAE